MGKNHSRWFYRLVILLLSIILILLLVRLIKNLQEPLRVMAIMEAESAASDIMNDAMKYALSQYEGSAEDFVVYQYDEKGAISAYGIDTIAVNALSTIVQDAMSRFFAERGDYDLKIPMGQITGNPLLAALGPDLPIVVRPIGNADINYEQEFISAGINQINHKVWLKMSFHIQIASPLLTEVLTASQDFMLVDRLLAGSVPPTYVAIPGLENQ